MEKTIKNCFILCKSIILYKMCDTLVFAKKYNIENNINPFQPYNNVSWEDSIKHIVVPDKYYFIKYQRRIEIQNQEASRKKYEAWKKKNKEIVKILCKK